MVDIVELEKKTLAELREMAKQRNISGLSRLKKNDLILRLLRAQAEELGYIFGGGILAFVVLYFFGAERLKPIRRADTIAERIGRPVYMLNGL